MEKHHIFGKSNSPETLIVCHNCHDKITHDQNLLPPKTRSSKASKADKQAFEDVAIGSVLELFGRRLKTRRYKHGQDKRSR